ncbi:hypothetical protein Cgig2_013936 [Carnegiea gigantea]|uniref:Uncharacterized protein n=1 Tax=Carnegiea gigantea TaxID=171969 RepID=A0A9Q1Q4U3_9CARY|nr:hypothetical protein Cgig2_013936 [Carnegiea gigantea]
MDGALVAMEHNLDDLCGDVMSMNLSDEGRTSLASKSEAGIGVGQKSGPLGLNDTVLPLNATTSPPSALRLLPHSYMPLTQTQTAGLLTPAPRQTSGEKKGKVLLVNNVWDEEEVRKELSSIRAEHNWVPDQFLRNRYRSRLDRVQKFKNWSRSWLDWFQDFWIRSQNRLRSVPQPGSARGVTLETGGEGEAGDLEWTVCGRAEVEYWNLEWSRRGGEEEGTKLEDGEEVASYHRTSFDDDADVENDDDPIA